ncbi:UNVERIFIED_CONTAM: hypothetical protein Sradi_3172500, partial [Sesamum radiatum]
DLGFERDIFIWCNRRETPDTVRARLNRAWNNPRWADLFQRATITHETVACSDHLIIWIDLDGKPLWGSTSQKCHFRFEEAWTSAPDCADVVKQAWSLVKDPSSHKSLIEKIRATRLQLSQWNKDNYRNIIRKSKELNEKIGELQRGSITSSVKAEVEELRDSLKKMAAKEEIL